MSLCRIARREAVFSKRVGISFLELGKAVGEFKAVVGLYAFNDDAAAAEPGCHFFEEAGGGVGALFIISPKETQTSVLINGGVLEKTQFRVGNTGAWDDLDIDLNPLTRVGHLFIGFGRVGHFLLGSRQEFQASHDTEEGFRPAGVAVFAQPTP